MEVLNEQGKPIGRILQYTGEDRLLVGSEKAKAGR